MSNIKIEPATQEYYNELLEVYMEGFSTKFRFITDDEKLRNESIHDFGIVDL
jgi:hypothetical protein